MGQCHQADTDTDAHVQNVVSWEMVMADGEIRTIVAEDEPELAVAMKGSGSQFGEWFPWFPSCHAQLQAPLY